MMKLSLLWILAVFNLTAYSQHPCPEAYPNRMVKAFKITRKIDKKAHTLSKSDFDKYLKQPNDYFERLTAKRNKLIFQNCECPNNPVDSMKMEFDKVEILNSSNTDKIAIFNEGIIRIEDLVKCNGCERNYKFYHKAWNPTEKQKTLEILEYRKYKSREKGLELFEIWVRPNGYNDLGLVYFVKVLNGSKVCVIPAPWTEI